MSWHLFHVRFLFWLVHGTELTFQGASVGQWFPAFDNSATPISGGLSRILPGICIPVAQAFTDPYLALFDRQFRGIYSGYFATELQFLINVEKLHDLS